MEGNCGRTVGVIPDSHPSTLGAALSFQIQTTIIPGEKMVVIHPGRHHWLESGAESHFFHPMHKSGIFRHTLSYMTTMEIRSFTYRFLRRNINGAQLFKHQRYKRNVSQLLYRTLNKNEIDSLITQLSLKSLRSCRPCRLRLLWVLQTNQVWRSSKSLHSETLHKVFIKTSHEANALKIGCDR